MSSPAVRHPFPAYRVAIYLANAMLNRTVETLLRAQPALAQVRRCADRDSATAMLDTGEIDVLIVAASDTNWLLELAGRPARSQIKILAMMDVAAHSYIAGRATGTVDGYLAPDKLSTATLQDALWRCSTGEMPMPEGLARALLAHADAAVDRPDRLIAKLTARESEVLVLLVEGLTNQQIARRLGISSHGAKRLVANIMLKLNAPNRTAAAVRAIRAGLVECQ